MIRRVPLWHRLPRSHFSSFRRTLAGHSLGSIFQSSSLHKSGLADDIRSHYYPRSFSHSKFSHVYARRQSTAGAMSKAIEQEKRSKSNALQIPRPSASVLLISPTNQILLLHRVRTSSAFPSAHVFPGGNCDEFHDGAIPPPNSSERHVDGEAYRMAAIRETFEESGILLAKNAGFGRLIEVEDAEREEVRKLVHTGKVKLEKWLAGKGGRADTEGLIPFTRWITPTNVPKRFTTQMYIYFLPVASTHGSPSTGPITSGKDALIPMPTHDGGLEHTAARFLPPQSWINMAQSGEIILFPPQLYLLSLIAPFLSPQNVPNIMDPEQLSHQRQLLKDFLKTGDPPWAEMCISPTQLMKRKEDGRVVLGLDKPGPELRDSGRKGDADRVALVAFAREGPRNVEIRWRKDVLEAEREFKEKL